MLEHRVGGKRRRESLGHRDHEKAKRQADLAAARLSEAETPSVTEEEKPQELTLQALLDM